MGRNKSTKQKRISKLKLSFWMTLTAGVTFSYFIYLSWRKLTELLGDSDLAWMISGGLVVVFILAGYFSFDKIVDNFVD